MRDLRCRGSTAGLLALLSIERSSVSTATGAIADGQSHQSCGDSAAINCARAVGVEGVS